MYGMPYIVSYSLCGHVSKRPREHILSTYLSSCAHFGKLLKIGHSGQQALYYLFLFPSFSQILLNFSVKNLNIS